MYKHVILYSWIYIFERIQVPAWFSFLIELSNVFLVQYAKMICSVNIGTFVHKIYNVLTEVTHKCWKSIKTAQGSKTKQKQNSGFLSSDDVHILVIVSIWKKLTFSLEVEGLLRDITGNREASPLKTLSSLIAIILWYVIFQSHPLSRPSFL